MRAVPQALVLAALLLCLPAHALGSTRDPAGLTAPASLDQEAADVARLQQMLQAYYANEQEAARVQPSAEELAQRESARADAEALEQTPFNDRKVRLTGAEGSTALAAISRRLSDPTIAESRRDMAPICVIRTRLFGTLVDSESRSLQPVGKHHYVARVRLQPGDTSLTVLDDRWELRLPEHAPAEDFIITLHRPPGASPELHVFAVRELLAQEQVHIPAWLPEELALSPGRG